MRWLLTVALLCCCVPRPAQAQRGGMHGSGAGHVGGGVGFHGGLGGASRPGFTGGSRPGAFRSSGSTLFRPGYGYQATGRSYSAFRYPGGYPFRPGRYPYGGRPRPFFPGYAFAGPLNFGYPEPFWDFADSFSSDQAPYGSPPPESAYGDPSAELSQAPASDPYQGQPADPYQGQPMQPYAPQARDGSQPMVYAPYAYANGGSQATVVTLPAPQREEDAVTLFFRDGRPPEQIRNYALTRRSLLITGPRMREIPLDELDLVLTERVNRAAGVEFRLPQSNEPLN